MIAIIAAMTRQRVIGKGNGLPWSIPDEMKHFRTATSNSTVIMGMRTFESIGRPLLNRNNIVLSHEAIEIPGVDVCMSIEAALDRALDYQKDVFVIGGAYTYAQFLPYVDYLYLSYIKQDYQGDVLFPPFDLAEWEECQRQDYPDFEYVQYSRKS